MKDYVLSCVYRYAELVLDLLFDRGHVMLACVILFPVNVFGGKMVEFV